MAALEAISAAVTERSDTLEADDLRALLRLAVAAVRDIERIVSTVFDEVAEALVRGDRVELRGFGAFSVRQRGSRVGRNPRTGDEVKVPDKVVPYFKTGKDLRLRLNAEG